MSVFNGLTDAQIERLVFAIEEAAEVQHALCKILRNGLYAPNPMTGMPNKENLEVELGHLKFALDLLIANGDVFMPNVINHARQKCFTIEGRLRYNHIMPEVITSKSDF